MLLTVIVSHVKLAINVIFKGISVEHLILTRATAAIPLPDLASILRRVSEAVRERGR